MRRRTAVAAIALLLSASCGSASKSEIQVTGEIGKKPVVTFPSGTPRLTSFSRTITEGTGATLKDGDVVSAKVTVYMWDGKENKTIGSDYDGGRAEFVTVNPQMPKSLHEAMLGARPGSRVLAVVAKDQLSPDQVTAAKQQGADFTTASQVLVIDVLGTAPKAAQGAATDPGQPGITLVNPGDDAAPTLTTRTDRKPPTKLVVKTIIKGTGPAVAADQTVLAHYTGKIWGTDKQFDSSWERGEPATFALNQVVKGWSQGLTGVPVGSRVLLTIPPDLGYGKNGQPDAGIKGTDTLVFVVDLLGAV